MLPGRHPPPPRLNAEPPPLPGRPTRILPVWPTAKPFAARLTRPCRLWVCRWACLDRCQHQAALQMLGQCSSPGPVPVRRLHCTGCHSPGLPRPARPGRPATRPTAPRSPSSRIRVMTPEVLAVTAGCSPTRTSLGVPALPQPPCCGRAGCPASTIGRAVRGCHSVSCRLGPGTADTASTR